MTVFSQLAVAVSSGTWFSWWEEVQFSGCYKYRQCLQSPAMLLCQKLLKVFSLNSKSFGQPWQDSESIRSILMVVRNNLGEASLCSGESSGLWTRWAATHGSDSGVLASCGPHYALPPSPVSLSLDPAAFMWLSFVCWGPWGRAGASEEALKAAQRGGSAHAGCLPLPCARGPSSVGGQVLASC